MQSESVIASPTAAFYEDERYEVRVFGRLNLPTALAAPQAQPDPQALGLRLMERDFLATEFGLPAHRIFMLAQEHGTEVHQVGPDSVQSNTKPLFHKGDGLITREPDLVLCIRTADCLPAFFMARTTQAVAVIHAGWRGLCAGILERAQAMMPAGKLDVLLGPCIGPEAYEVGPEVAAHFSPASITRPYGREHLDIPGDAARRLGRPGLKAGACTFDDNPHYFSHRRGDAARNLNVIRIKQP